MKVFIFHSTAGEGHKKIAEAITRELKTRKELQDVRLIDPFEFARPHFRKSYPAVYYFSVKLIPSIWGFFYFLFDIPMVYRVLWPLRYAFNRYHSKALRAFILNEKPDCVITTHFYSAQVLAEMRYRGEFHGKLVTVITDVMPHAFWVNRGTDIYWVMATASEQSLIERGVSQNSIVVGGIPIKDEFSKREHRTRLALDFGLTAGRFNILFSSGSFGFGPTQQWIKELEPLGSCVQVLVICGNNRKLYENLAKQKYTFPVVLMGFINNMHEVMSVCDLIVAKSGGSTMCESLAKGLPMIISAPIPGQETRNAKWLLANGSSLQISKKGDLKKIIQTLLDNPARLEKLRENMKRIAMPNAVNHVANFIVNGKISHD